MAVNAFCTGLRARDSRGACVRQGLQTRHPCYRHRAAAAAALRGTLCVPCNGLAAQPQGARDRASKREFHAHATIKVRELQRLPLLE